MAKLAIVKEPDPHPPPLVDSAKAIKREVLTRKGVTKVAKIWDPLSDPEDEAELKKEIKRAIRGTKVVYFGDAEYVPEVDATGMAAETRDDVAYNRWLRDRCIRGYPVKTVRAQAPIVLPDGTAITGIPHRVDNMDGYKYGLIKGRYGCASRVFRHDPLIHGNLKNKPGTWIYRPVEGEFDLRRPQFDGMCKWVGVTRKEDPLAWERAKRLALKRTKQSRETRKLKGLDKDTIRKSDGLGAAGESRAPTILELCRQRRTDWPHGVMPDDDWKNYRQDMEEHERRAVECVNVWHLARGVVDFVKIGNVTAAKLVLDEGNLINSEGLISGKTYNELLDSATLDSEQLGGLVTKFLISHKLIVEDGDWVDDLPWGLSVQTPSSIEEVKAEIIVEPREFVPAPPGVFPLVEPDHSVVPHFESHTTMVPVIPHSIPALDVDLKDPRSVDLLTKVRDYLEQQKQRVSGLLIVAKSARDRRLIANFQDAMEDEDDLVIEHVPAPGMGGHGVATVEEFVENGQQPGKLGISKDTNMDGLMDDLNVELEVGVLKPLPPYPMFEDAEVQALHVMRWKRSGQLRQDNQLDRRSEILEKSKALHKRRAGEMLRRCVEAIIDYQPSHKRDMEIMNAWGLKGSMTGTGHIKRLTIRNYLLNDQPTWNKAWNKWRTVRRKLFYTLRIPGPGRYMLHGYLPVKYRTLDVVNEYNPSEKFMAWMRNNLFIMSQAPYNEYARLQSWFRDRLLYTEEELESKVDERKIHQRQWFPPRAYLRVRRARGKTEDTRPSKGEWLDSLRPKRQSRRKQNRSGDQTVDISRMVKSTHFEFSDVSGLYIPFSHVVAERVIKGIHHDLKREAA